jgi:energy-converting hydrogenase Eha subunit A
MLRTLALVAFAYLAVAVGWYFAFADMFGLTGVPRLVVAAVVGLLGPATVAYALTRRT